MLQTMNNNTTSTTTIACHNIFNDLVNGELITRNTNTSFNGGFRLLDKGIISTTNCDLCCPACGGIYYFGKATMFAEGFVPFVFEEEDLSPSGKLECCVNYAGNFVPEDILGGMSIYDPNDPENPIPVGYDLCTTGNFGSCLQQLQNTLGTSLYNDLLDSSEGGIVEYSTIGGSSMICNIITQLQLSPVYTSELLYLFLVQLLNKGVVIKCKDDLIIGASVETYFKWAEIADGGGGGVPPASPITQ